jgi:hypothetical protein
VTPTFRRKVAVPVAIKLSGSTELSIERRLQVVALARRLDAHDPSRGVAAPGMIGEGNREAVWRPEHVDATPEFRQADRSTAWDAEPELMLVTCRRFLPAHRRPSLWAYAGAGRQGTHTATARQADR